MSDETTPGPDLCEQIERILDDAYGFPPSICAYQITDIVEAALDAKDAEIKRLTERIPYREGETDEQYRERQIARWRSEAWQARGKLHQADATVARVKALAEDMRTWCSPHGIAVLYAQRIDEAIEPPAPVGIEADSEAEFAAKHDPRGEAP